MSVFYNNKLIRYYSRKFNESFLNFIFKNLSKTKATKNTFFLSFDCDTEENYKFYENLLIKLSKYNFKSIFAVPGSFMKKNPSLFQEIYSLGHEFINHGFYQHTKYFKNKDFYHSYFFYKNLPDQIIVDDILKGHDVLTKIVGEKNIKGFRTPHFGSFDKKNNLNLIYETIKKLGYSYSSSTMPYRSYLQGQIYKNPKFDIYEIPLTGMLKIAPFNIFDSWTVRYADNKKTFSNWDYFKIFESNLNYVIKNHTNFILNYYVDPRQVYHYKPFNKSLDLMFKYASNFYNCTYQNFINEIN